MDMNLSNDPYESYRIFQGRIVDQYESLVKSEGWSRSMRTGGSRRSR